MAKIRWIGYFEHDGEGQSVQELIDPNSNVEKAIKDFIHYMKCSGHTFIREISREMCTKNTLPN